MPWQPPLEEEFGDLLDEANDEFASVLSFTIRRLTSYTPFDTGRLMGGWANVGVNSDPPTIRQPDDTPSGSFAIANMDAVASLVQLGDNVFVVNPTPYASFINDGTSRISPRLMIERTVADIQSEFGS